MATHRGRTRSTTAMLVRTVVGRQSKVPARKAQTQRVRRVKLVNTSRAMRPGKQAAAKAKKHARNTRQKTKLKKLKLKSGGARKLPKIRLRSTLRKRTVGKKPHLKPHLKPLRPQLRRRVQIALRELRHGKSLKASARSAGLSRRRLRKLLIKRELAKVRNGHWIVSRRGSARMMTFSNGKKIYVQVSRKTAIFLGNYLNAIGRFRETNDLELLDAYIGQSIKDVSRNVYPLETRPNVLFRLTAAVEPYEEIYRLLI